MPLLSSPFRLARLLTAALLANPFTRASAPPPVIQGSFSTHHRSLVITSFQYGPTGEGGGRPIRSITYDVLTPVTPDGPLALHAPITLLGPGWSVTPSDIANRWPMITDDGNTLLLLLVTEICPDLPLLRIYRRTGYTATLIRTLSSSNLLTPRESNPTGPGLCMIKDSGPLWFSLGALRFTADDQDLRYTSPDGHKLNIHLADGAVTRLPKAAGIQHPRAH